MEACRVGLTAIRQSLVVRIHAVDFKFRGLWKNTPSLWFMFMVALGYVGNENSMVDGFYLMLLGIAVMHGSSTRRAEGHLLRLWYHVSRERCLQLISGVMDLPE